MKKKILLSVLAAGLVLPSVSALAQDIAETEDVVLKVAPKNDREVVATPSTAPVVAENPVAKPEDKKGTSVISLDKPEASTEDVEKAEMEAKKEMAVDKAKSEMAVDKAKSEMAKPKMMKKALPKTSAVK